MVSRTEEYQRSKHPNRKQGGEVIKANIQKATLGERKKRKANKTKKSHRKENTTLMIEPTKEGKGGDRVGQRQGFFEGISRKTLYGEKIKWGAQN